MTNPGRARLRRLTPWIGAALALVVLEVVWNAVLDGVADGIAELLSGPGGSG